MVSFWPFGREDASSPKSFEKALATLSDKIQRLQVRDDTLRATHRRIKVLFTLYGSFIYILATVILILVTGYENWNKTEWTAVAGSPVGIFVVRYFVDLYFDWREANVRTRLERKTKERDVVIKKLKDAMRYDSTKELLDKYGGLPASLRPTPARTKSPKSAHSRQSSGNQTTQTQRTGFAPPPTANIPGRNPPAQNADARLRNISGQQPSPAQSVAHSRQPSASVSESFAPNAYEDWQHVPPTTQHFPAAPSQSIRSGFLDRMLDLIVGEDESAPRNRIVLLCTSCRTVNGQAPPGTTSLEELGKWRCGTCNAWNGMESEVGRALKQAKAKDVGQPHTSQVVRPTSTEVPEADTRPKHEVRIENKKASSSDEEDIVSTATAGSARSKARQRQDS